MGHHQGLFHDQRYKDSLPKEVQLIPHNHLQDHPIFTLPVNNFSQKKRGLSIANLPNHYAQQIPFRYR